MKQININGIEKLKYGRREAINSLKTNIRFSGENIKVIEFTSCNPNEGKSTTGFNVALSFAESGEKVLFIDADMRKSTIKKTYQIDNDGKDIEGLSHYLSGQTYMNNVICKTNVENLDMVMVGQYSPNPTTLLDASRFDTLLETAKQEYDIVIIDSPPLGSVIDSAIIAPKCDGVVLVIEAGSTSAKSASEVVKQLEMTGCKILGCVLNKVSPKGKSYSYKYKYRYYGAD